MSPLLASRLLHAVAWLLQQARGSLPKQSLLELLYLADRESMRQYGAPLTMDQATLGPAGPRLERLAQYLEDAWPSAWGSWLARDRYRVALRASTLKEDQLDRLSDADLRVLREVWQQWGTGPDSGRKAYLRALPEVQGKAVGSALSYEDLFLALGLPATTAGRAARDIRLHQQMDEWAASSASRPASRCGTSALAGRWPDEAGLAARRRG